jgi:GNAT superfamily N-acetyltransferase
MNVIKIAPYGAAHQPGIDAMMQEIAAEFHFPITLPGSKPAMPAIYWVALDGADVAGTVGLNIEGNYGVLKKMMLKKEYRGRQVGVSALLLQTAINYCIGNQLKTLYLGTIGEMRAAERFYLKNGFTPITRDALPHRFPDNPIDDTYYKLDLNN